MQTCLFLEFQHVFIIIIIIIDWLIYRSSPITNQQILRYSPKNLQTRFKIIDKQLENTVSHLETVILKQLFAYFTN